MALVDDDQPVAANNPLLDDDDDAPIKLTAVAPADGPAADAHPRRGEVLLYTCLASSANAFLFMNFSPVVDLSEEVFGASAADVSWLYSASLLAVLPCFFAAGPFVAAPATQRRALVLTHALNFVAAALRVAAVALRSYWVALASSLALGAAQGDHHLLHDAFKMPVPRFPDRGVGYRSGAAASLVISSFASVPLVWLPSDELGAGVAATVQSNFFGWFLGAVVVPYFRRADISPMNRGDAAAATWIFRGDESRRRRG